MMSKEYDERLKILRSAFARHVFDVTASEKDFWQSYPYDVPSLHTQARHAFVRALEDATHPEVKTGRLLLLLGESGVGKTHLMRALRNHTHVSNKGYFIYVNMGTVPGNFQYHLLDRVITCLDQPHDWALDQSTTSLRHLSNRLTEGLPPDRLALLDEERLTYREVGTVVDELAAKITHDHKCTNIDINLIRSLVYLQADDADIRSLVKNYLLEFELSEFEKERVCALSRRPTKRASIKTIEDIGNLIWHFDQQSLVICIDQMEDLIRPGAPDDALARCVRTMVSMASNIVHSVVVFSMTTDVRPTLDKLDNYIKDRVFREHPIALDSVCSIKQTRDLLEARLRYIYHHEGMTVPPADLLFPLREEELATMAGYRPRDVVKSFAQVINGDDWTTPVSGQKTKTTNHVRDIQALWLAHRRTAPAVPADDDRLVQTLTEGLNALPMEGVVAGTVKPLSKQPGVLVDISRPALRHPAMLIGLCNKPNQVLSRHVKALEETAADGILVLLRENEFPSNPKTQIGKKLREIRETGGRTVTIDPEAVCTMAAWLSFRKDHHENPAFGDWVTEQRVLTTLPHLRTLLGLDDTAGTPSPGGGFVTDPDPPALSPALSHNDLFSRPGPQAAAPGAETTLAPSPSPSALPPSAAVSIRPAALVPFPIGVSQGLSTARVDLDPASLVRHAAFLGGTGSGKTTLALTVLEHLLEADVPAVLIDRKGDLATYADPAAWTRPLETAAAVTRRDRLRARLDVALYTPAKANGRGLPISLFPDDGQTMADDEREEAVQESAAALAGMLRLRDDIAQQVLAQALGVLVRARSGPVTLPDLIDVMDKQDPEFVRITHRLDQRGSITSRLISRLESLRLNRESLFQAEGDRLDLERLLGLGQHQRPGRTRLTIIYTGFLGDEAGIQFWVSQFLAEANRFSRRHPSDRLQCVLLLDEADHYMPATAKPPTKAPLENLLRRARSAGLCVMLSTQSPGDLDYRARDQINTWFIGRVREQTAIAKLRPVFQDSSFDPMQVLPRQETGAFHLVAGAQATPIRADRSLVNARQISGDRIVTLAAGTVAVP